MFGQAWTECEEAMNEVGRSLPRSPRAVAKRTARAFFDFEVSDLAQPHPLHLTGPAGGTWSSGTDGPNLELDAVEFCRTVSGRQHGDGLLAVAVPF